MRNTGDEKGVSGMSSLAWDCEVDAPRLVLLLYDSRSGSTFLSALLNSYKDVGVTVESNFIRTLLLGRSRIAQATDTSLILDLLNREPRFSNLGSDLNELSRILEETSGPEYTIEKITRSVLTEYFDRIKPEARHWVVKDGGNGFLIEQIAREFPTALFIHIIRDGRAVMNSKFSTDRPYEKGRRMGRDVLTIARLWVDLLRRIDSFSERNPGCVLTVRYEDLISDTQEEMNRICAFLGVPQAVATSCSSYVEKIPEHEQAIHENVGKEAIPERINAWKRQADPSEIRVFEHLAAHCLEKHRYITRKRSGRLRAWASPAFVRVYISSILRRILDWHEYIVDSGKLRRILQNKKLRYLS